MILYWTESVSAVYYPAENVEIVNTVLSPIYPLSEWRICLFFFFLGCMCTSNKKKADLNLAPLLNLVKNRHWVSPFTPGLT